MLILLAHESSQPVFYPSAKKVLLCESPKFSARVKLLKSFRRENLIKLYKILEITEKQFVQNRQQQLKIKLANKFTNLKNAN